MTLKKMFCTIIAAAAMTVFSGAAVYADAIAEPDNAFYRSGYKSCEYINWRRFNVLEDSDILRSPLKTSVASRVKKGDIVDIGFIYTDKNGDVWGCCMFYGSADADSDGWIKMSKVSEIYSTFTFIDEHSDEFSDYSGELDNYIPQEKVVLWEYPYSENYYSIKAENWYTREDYPYPKGELANKCWTDENGNMWIYSGRWITKDADRFDNRWVFLPDPEATDLSSFGYDISANEGTAVSGQLIDEMTENASIFAERSVAPVGRSLMLPTALSTGAAVISLLLIKLMKK